MKDVFAFNYHAEESNASWMIRATDDMVINFDLLPEYLRDLQNRYDPNTDVVIRSHCLQFNDKLYPQGGSGAIFSRAASVLLSRDTQGMIANWIESEDITLGNYIEKKGIEMVSTIDPHFLGLGWGTVEAFEQRIQTVSDVCEPPDPTRTDCVRCFVAPLREVVFYHSEGSGSGMDIHHEVSRRVFNAHHSIMWYPGDRWAAPELCLANTSERDGRQST
jgi:hypothetical protein